MTWFQRLEGVVALMGSALRFLDNPEVLFYVMFGMTVVAWVLVILLLAGVI